MAQRAELRTAKMALLRRSPPPAQVVIFRLSANFEPIPGDVAQLGERGVRNAEVEGSIPFVSIIISTN